MDEIIKKERKTKVPRKAWYMVFLTKEEYKTLKSFGLEIKDLGGK